ncbi:MAG: DDE-type integrase/transposase/recombinase [Gemmatimonadaceae bacterium]
MTRALIEEAVTAGARRGRAKAPVRQAPRAHVATGPNQVWSWDITYLPTPVRGLFRYLYQMMDVWSRDIVGWDVHDVESAAHAAALFVRSCRVQGRTRARSCCTPTMADR